MSTEARQALRAAIDRSDWRQAEAALAAQPQLAGDPALREALREGLVADGRIHDAVRLLPAPAQPVSAGDWLALAVAAHAAGRFPQAADAARRALALAPDAAGWNHLGRALHNLGRPVEALDAFRRAVAIAPDFAPGWQSLGVAERAAGRLSPACEAFARAWRLRPSARGAALNLGKTQLAAERPAEALATFERWLDVAPDDADARVHAGLALHQLGRLDASEAAYRRALDGPQPHPLAWLYLGILLNQQHRSGESEAALRRACALLPQDPECWAELAGFLEVESRLDEMAEVLRRGLAIAPQEPRLRLESAILDRRLGEPARALATMHSIAPVGLPLRVAMRYHYELGQLLDGEKQPDAAIAAFTEANRLARGGAAALADEAAALLSRYGRIAALCRARPPAGWPASAAEPARPIFLLGFPRSGTTLLRRMLSAHPALTSLEEQATLEDCIPFVDALPGGYPDALPALDDAGVRRLRAHHRARVAACGGGGTDIDCVVDTHPYRSPHLPLIQRLFPQARVIFLQRHPCDVVLSCFMQPFAANAANWHFHTLADSVGYYRAFMDAWLAAEAAAIHPPVTLRYEDLVAAREARLRALLAELDIPWDDAVLRHHEHGAGGRVTTSSYQQVVKPVYLDARERWRRYRRHLEPFFADLAPYIARFGYTLDAPPSA